ncbi:MAG: hypothetical protein IPJ03_08400 [Ignavibacteriales bacterium]|nr:hypothetical protein [Ignavibacteriales bacterium]
MHYHNTPYLKDVERYMNIRIEKYLVILLVALSFIRLSAQSHSIRFKNLDVEQGLSQNMIRICFRIQKGFMWIGTWDGLNRYDGYNFKVYKHIDGDSASLITNKIGCLLEDHKGRLWIGTFGGGLSLFNRGEESFTNYVHNPNDRKSISGDQILSLFEDSKQRIWVGIRNGGVALIEEENSKTANDNSLKFINFLNDSSNPKSISGTGIMSITEDKSGSIWFGTNDGTLNKLIESNGKLEFIQFRSELKIIITTSSNLFWKIIFIPVCSGFQITTMELFGLIQNSKNLFSIILTQT